MSIEDEGDPGASKKKTAKKKPKRAKKAAKSKAKASAGTAKFPRHSVEKALRVPRAIIDQNAGHECTEAESAEFVGVGYNGPYRSKSVLPSNMASLSVLPPVGLLSPIERAKRSVHKKLVTT